MSTLQIEDIEVGGGYGDAGNATGAAGGIDLDNAGNISMDGDLLVGGTLGVTGVVSMDGLNLAGDLTVGTDGTGNIIAGTGNTTVAVLNTVATTVNAFGAATSVNVGADTAAWILKGASFTFVQTASPYSVTVIADATGNALFAADRGAVTNVAYFGTKTAGVAKWYCGTYETTESFNIGTAYAGAGKLVITTAGNGSIAGTWAVTGGTLTVGAAAAGNIGTVTNSNQIAFVDATNTTIEGNAQITLDLAVNGGDLTSTATTFNLLNATVTTLNIGAAATAINLGAATGTLTISNAEVALNAATISTDETTVALLNATVTTVNAFGAATAINVGAATGTFTVNNAATALNCATVSSDETTVALWNTTCTTVNAFGAATSINLGAATGTLTISNAILAVNCATVSTDETTIAVFNTTATTINLGGASTAINVGAATGSFTVSNATTALNSTAVTSDETTVALWNATCTTVNAFGAATAINLGAATGTLTISNAITAINSATISTDETTVAFLNTTATTVNAFGASAATAIGAATGTTTIGHDLTVTGDALVTSGTVVHGVNSTTRGVVTTWDGGGTAAPGVWNSYSTDGTGYWYFAGNDGTLRMHTSLPTANTDGTALVTVDAYSGISRVSTPAAGWAITATADVWEKVDLTGGFVAHEDAFTNAVANAANSWITIGANGAGTYQSKFHISANSGGANDDMWFGVAITFATPIDIASISAATPPVVTTTSAHGFNSGSTAGSYVGVIISGVTGAGDETNINTSHLALVTGTTTFTLYDLAGVAVAASTVDASTGDVVVEVHGETLCYNRFVLAADADSVACLGKIDLVAGDTVHAVAGADGHSNDMTAIAATLEIARV